MINTHSRSTGKPIRQALIGLGTCLLLTTCSLTVPFPVFGTEPVAGDVPADCCDANTVVLGTAASKSRPSASKAAPDADDDAPTLMLGIGDAVSVQVYSRPELNTTTYVSDDGTVPVPLAGNVAVAGLSPAAAGQSIAAAFRKGQYLVDPQVTVFLVQSRSRQVSVLGAVRTPGRFTIESKTTVLDLLAQAGGATENGADSVVLIRADKAGVVTRYSIDLAGLSQQNQPLPTLTLRGGDTVFVPVAEQYYINGEVHTPNGYRLESGMTVAQAIARSGGVTARGSSSRIEITRRKADGTTLISSGQLGELVQANDIIRIKERIF